MTVCRFTSGVSPRRCLPSLTAPGLAGSAAAERMHQEADRARVGVPGPHLLRQQVRRAAGVEGGRAVAAALGEGGERARHRHHLGRARGRVRQDRVAATCPPVMRERGLHRGVGAEQQRQVQRAEQRMCSQLTGALRVERAAAPRASAGGT